MDFSAPRVLIGLLLAAGLLPAPRPTSSSSSSTSSLRRGAAGPSLLRRAAFSLLRAPHRWPNRGHELALVLVLLPAPPVLLRFARTTVAAPRLRRSSSSTACHGRAAAPSRINSGNQAKPVPRQGCCSLRLLCSTAHRPHLNKKSQCSSLISCSSPSLTVARHPPLNMPFQVQFRALNMPFQVQLQAL